MNMLILIWFFFRKICNSFRDKKSLSIGLFGMDIPGKGVFLYSYFSASDIDCIKATTARAKNNFIKMLFLLPSNC